jgi:hypothetical protein
VTLAEIQEAFDLVDSNRLYTALLFDVKAPAAVAGVDPKAWLYVYYSPLRSFSGVAYILKSLGLDDSTGAALNIVHRGNKIGMLFTNKLLALDRVRDFDLQLDWARTYLPMLRDYVGTAPGGLIAFRDSKPSEKYGSNAYMLFKNPRGIWQLSRFAPGVGPVGHIEGTPSDLTKDAMFHRPDDGGYIDDIMASVGAQ